jgi:ABC-2 type transport system permease protein
MSLIVIAIVVAVNLIFAQLPDSVTEPDLSSLKLYDFTDETINTAKAIKEKVTIYLWAEKGREDMQITEFLSRYGELNSNIEIKYIDPAIHPDFMSEYTEETPSANSLVVRSEKRSKVVDYYEIYRFNYDQETLYQYYMYYGEYYMSYLEPNVFNAEDAITNAVDYVTSSTLPVAYLLTGHGEAAFSETIKQYISDENIELKELNLVGKQSVPEDASCVIINVPAEDISAYELDLLLAYMNGGGSIMLFTDYKNPGAQNIAKLCEAYGLEAVEGIVAETSENYVNYPYYIIAKQVSHKITEPLIEKKSYVLVPLAHGIKTIDAYRSSLEISTLLETSEGSYSKTEDVSELTTWEKEAGDIEGGFILGAAVTETVGDKESKFVWYSSGYLLDGSIDYFVGGGNSNLILNTFGWMAEREQRITIRSLPISVEKLNITKEDSTLWFIVLTFAIPVLLLGFGFVVWYRRRKR